MRPIARDDPGVDDAGVCPASCPILDARVLSRSAKGYSKRQVKGFEESLINLFVFTYRHGSHLCTLVLVCNAKYTVPVAIY